MGLKRGLPLQQRASLSEQAYTEIKAAIIAGRFSPLTAVSEYRLADLLGMSRTPVREALSRLEADGFVTNITGKGALVRPVTAELALEVLEYREAVESMACRLAASRMDDATRLQLAQLCLATPPPSDVETLNKISATLHTAIRDACGNAMLQNSLDRIRDHLARLRAVALEIPGRLQQSFLEHQPIVDALVRRDEDAAEAAMRRHNVSAKTSLFQALFESRFSTAGRPAPGSDGTAAKDRGSQRHKPQPGRMQTR